MNVNICELKMSINHFWPKIVALARKFAEEHSIKFHIAYMLHLQSSSGKDKYVDTDNHKYS